MKARFRVVGLYCTSCKSVIEKSLRGNKAIKGLDLDFMTDSVIVEYDEKAIRLEDIRKELEKSGYRFSRVAT